MQAVIASSSSAVPPFRPHTATKTLISGKHLPFLGRRKLCCDVVSRLPVPSPTSRGDGKEDIFTVEQGLLQDNLPRTTRRTFFARLLVSTCYSYLLPSRYFQAYALGDPSVTVEQVTPSVFSAGPLFPTEERIVKLFEKNTYSVVNIFDVTLRPQLNVTGAVEIPEGNGSGVVWDEQGHIVTNYHVIGNSLSRNPSIGQVVARVNILAAEG
ncbi:hypothetical protein MIMGU_mgv1a0098121mg, partial [Erythranthe guttata]